MRTVMVTDLSGCGLDWVEYRSGHLLCGFFADDLVDLDLTIFRFLIRLIRIQCCQLPTAIRTMMKV